jgi:hypothetical protein
MSHCLSVVSPALAFSLERQCQEGDYVLGEVVVLGVTLRGHELMEKGLKTGEMTIMRLSNPSAPDVLETRERRRKFIAG